VTEFHLDMQSIKVNQIDIGLGGFDNSELTIFVFRAP